MRSVKRIAGVLGALALAYLFGSFFLDELGDRGRGGEPAGVLFGPPPGFRVVEGGELDRIAAARRLGELVAAAGDGARVGLHFSTGGAEIYWLAEIGGGGAAKLTELAAGGNGTRVETTFEGELAARLRWAAERGRFDAPGTAPAVSRNLYH